MNEYTNCPNCYSTDWVITGTTYNDDGGGLEFQGYSCHCLVCDHNWTNIPAWIDEVDDDTQPVDVKPDDDFSLLD